MISLEKNIRDVACTSCGKEWKHEGDILTSNCPSGHCDPRAAVNISTAHSCISQPCSNYAMNGSHACRFHNDKANLADHYI